ncbi:MAG: hypothetical protein H0V89_13895 [Deltaproteobacteria bacterium]|nr:hypothetical protein [Deltaproteobacteria bacterium]
MKRWMLFGGVGIAGIILAFLLFPKPDTGDVPVAAEPDPAAEEGARPRGPVGVRPGGVGRPGIERPPILKNGPSPVALENIKRMSVPDALYAGRLTSPLAVIRRQLQLLGEPEAEALGVKVDLIIGHLREQRRDPEAHGMPTLIASSRAWLDEVKASRFAEMPEIAPQFARFDAIVAEYQQAKDNPEAAPPPAGGVTAPAPVPTEGE